MYGIRFGWNYNRKTAADVTANRKNNGWTKKVSIFVEEKVFFGLDKSPPEECASFEIIMEPYGCGREWEYKRILKHTILVTSQL